FHVTGVQTCALPIFITPGIQKLESSSDVRETGTIYLPPPDPAEALPDNAELFFFFHDAPHDEDWELVLTFADGIDGNWILNGREIGRASCRERVCVS